MSSKILSHIEYVSPETNSPKKKHIDKTQFIFMFSCGCYHERFINLIKNNNIFLLTEYLKLKVRY